MASPAGGGGDAAHLYPSRAIKAAAGHPGVKRTLTGMAPALLGRGVSQVSLMINTQISSHLAEGATSWLNYADRLMGFPIGLLGVALSAC